MLNDLVQNHDWNQLSKTVEELLRCYDFSINPIEIHREDKVEFNEILKIKLKDLKLPFKKTSFIISCTCRNYTIRIHRKTNERQDVFSLFTGFAPNETKSLSTIVSKKKKHLGSSDIWIIILLNRSIAPIDLLNFFYRPIELPIPLKQSLNEISEKSTFPSILQYEYHKTPWGVTFKDGQGHQHTIDEQLKCSIVIYPFSRSSFIFPAIKHFVSFSTPEYWNLKTILEAQGFRCNCALQSITFKQVSP